MTSWLREPPGGRVPGGEGYDGPAMAAQEGMLALVVEDDALVRSFLTRALGRFGYTADGAASAAEATALVERGAQYEIALLDGYLPDAHGLQLARRLLADPRASGMAICLLSGAVRHRVPVTAGMSALGKPPHLADLLDHVEAMRRWRSRGSTAAERLAALDRMEAALPVG